MRFTRNASVTKSAKYYERAIICFDGFTALEPQMANNYFQLADSYYQFYQEDAKTNGKPDLDLLNRAEKAVEAGLNIEQDDAAAHALKGEILKDKGELQESLKSYKKAVEIEPQTAIFWIKLGDAQVSLMQDNEAIESYNHALSIDPNDTLALYFLGLQYERMSRLKEAIETYEKIIKIEPSNEEILQKLKKLKEQRDSNKQPKEKAKSATVSNQ